MKTKINKLNFSLMIISWIITVWGIIAEKLSSSESTLNNKTKFWLSMTVPISTSIISFIESIQVGMDIKEVQVSKKLSLNNLNNTIIHNMTINNDYPELPKSYDFGNGLVISNVNEVVSDIKISNDVDNDVDVDENNNDNFDFD